MLQAEDERVSRVWFCVSYLGRDLGFICELPFLLLRKLVHVRIYEGINHRLKFL